MKILIIEDEMPAAQRLARLVKEVEPSAEIVETLDSVEATLNYLENNTQLDLLLMDIHLADGSCFEIFKYKHIQTPVIFTTAYDEYALQAFKTNAIDYLLKPIKKEELAMAFAKFTRFSPSFSEKIESLAADMTQLQRSPFGQYVERFLIRTGQTYRVVELKDISYFVSEDKISFAVKKDGKRYALDFTMDKLETMLDPKVFFRLNRQFITSLPAIEEMTAYSKSRVKVKLTPLSKEEPVVSSERTGEFKRWLVG
ncbi:MAG: response regulator transcription factor [Saprospiraceae bacterium]|nr:response regulator transcription factor [Saprospiraceae bacterium]